MVKSSVDTRINNYFIIENPLDGSCQTHFNGFFYALIFYGYFFRSSASWADVFHLRSEANRIGVGRGLTNSSGFLAKSTTF